MQEDEKLARSYFKYLCFHVDNMDTNIPSTKCYHTPDVIRLKKDQTLYVLGDLHGDFEVMWYALIAAELIDDRGNWIGGDSVLLQLGDMLDGRRISEVNYAGEQKILNFLKNLHIQALKSMGMVVTCLGNHDVYRLLAQYSDTGNIMQPDASYYFVNTDNIPLIPMNIDTYNAYTNYTSRHNRSDFNNGKSISRLGDPNSYDSHRDSDSGFHRHGDSQSYHRDSDSGFHRQLLASCATKLVVKVEWSNGSEYRCPGVLASHGDLTVNYLSELFKLLGPGLANIGDKYGLDFKRHLTNARDDQAVCFTIINSLFSFFLRKFHRTRISERRIFSSLVYKFVHSIFADKRSFLQCRPEQRNVCKESSDILKRFRLDPLNSSVLAAHSGPLYMPGPYKIKGWCDDQPDEDIHTNTYIMTDVMASRSFRDMIYDDGGNPQIVRLYLDRVTQNLNIQIMEATDKAENLTPMHDSVPEKTANPSITQLALFDLE